MNARLLFAVTVLSFVAPAVAAAQGAGTGLSVQGAVGTLIKGGGNGQSLSLVFSPGERIEFLVSAERMHLPTEVNRYENGFGVSRGGTTAFISGEVRFLPFTFNRVSPYVLGGAGRGTARPNVNDFFPDRVTHDATVLFAGGGVRVPVTGHLSAFADMRCVLQLDTSETGVFGFLPVRGGLAWRF
jgi:hypothetical protein